jgi:hypothetical protein
MSHTVRRSAPVRASPTKGIKRKETSVKDRAAIHLLRDDLAYDRAARKTCSQRPATTTTPA